MINGADTQYAPVDPSGVARNSLKPSLLTVNISGVTIDGDGVYAESGITFRDAQGTISRSRVTNIVTTETSYDVPRPGEYKGSNDGIAIASVTAPRAHRRHRAAADHAARDPRSITRRIDKYNGSGILLDGATNDYCRTWSPGHAGRLRRHLARHPRPEPDRRPHAVRQLRGRRQLLEPAGRHQRPAATARTASASPPARR